MIRLLRGEVRKLWTIWSTYIFFGLVVVFDLLFGLLVGLAPRRGGGIESRVPHGSSAWFSNIFGVLDNSRLLALVLGVLIITGEYRHKTVTPTYLAEPRRGLNVTAKLVIGFVSGLALGILTMLIGLAMGAGMVVAKVQSCTTFTGTPGANGRIHLTIDTMQGMGKTACAQAHGMYYVATGHTMLHALVEIAPGVVLGTGLFGLYGVGLGALLRNQIVGIVSGLGFTLVVEGIIQGVLPTVGEYLPGQAASAIENAPRVNFAGETAHLLPWWGGAIMVVIYAVVLAGAGTFTSLRADVT